MKRICLGLGPLLALGLAWFVPLPWPARITAALVAWMAVWWISECVPLAATALLPMAVLPMAGAFSGKAVAVQYINHIIFLFLGGFLLAAAMQRWRLHERIALFVLVHLGRFGARGLLAGAMLSAWFLSMWISNTATTMMLAPILLAVLDGMPEASARDRFGAYLLLGAAYAASIGGIATLIGTGPNLSFARIYELSFPSAPEIGFAHWAALGLPVSAGVLIAALLLLGLRVRGMALARAEEVVRERLAALGPTTKEEKLVLAVFALTALAWITRRKIELGAVSIPGWSELLPQPGYANDGVVACIAALVLFLLPARDGGRILRGEDILRLPWDIVLLLGGGFALAWAVRESGLAAAVGELLAGSKLPLAVLVPASAYATALLTEFTSNTATAETLLPIFAAAAPALGVHPVALMLPVAFSCSLAFMLPAATPPNAIVFATKRVPLATMVRTGVALMLLAPIVVSIVVLGLGPLLYGALDRLPAWALG